VKLASTMPSHDKRLSLLKQFSLLIF